MSTTSDSDEESEERKDLMERMQQFRAKKIQKEAAIPPLPPAVEEDTGAAGDEDSPLCVQIGWPRDYIEYTGIWEDCRRRGWELIGTDRRPMTDPSLSEHSANAAKCSVKGGRGTGVGEDSVCAEAGGGGGGGRLVEMIPNVQFVPYKKTAWAAVMKGQVLANLYLVRLYGGGL
jgi:hypothetical protein